jgi:hypothetical protein
MITLFLSRRTLIFLLWYSCVIKNVVNHMLPAVSKLSGGAGKCTLGAVIKGCFFIICDVSVTSAVCFTPIVYELYDCAIVGGLTTLTRARTS